MKKLLSAIFILCASQALLHGYENLNRFYSDDFPVKDICNNNPKALIFWKGSIEKACDCLDNGLGKPKKIVRAIERFKQDQDKQQLFNAFMIK